jgi:hypothetical protein
MSNVLPDVFQIIIYNSIKKQTAHAKCMDRFGIPKSMSPLNGSLPWQVVCIILSGHSMGKNATPAKRSPAALSR